MMGNDAAAITDFLGEELDTEGDGEEGSVRERTSMRFAMDFPGEREDGSDNSGRGAKILERSFGLVEGVRMRRLFEVGLVLRDRVGVLGRVPIRGTGTVVSENLSHTGEILTYIPV